MATIELVTVEAADPAASERFYAAAFEVGGWLRVRASQAPTTGFRGFTLSLVVATPASVDAVVGSALRAGATSLKPATKSLWGYGGVVQAPEGTIWTVASASKKDTGAVTGRIDEVVLQLGVADVAASKRYYVDRGFAVAKSYGRKYVELDTSSSPVSLSLYRHKALAKVAGVPADGTGSHRLVIGGDAGTFTDPDGFEWEGADSGSEAAPRL